MKLFTSIDKFEGRCTSAEIGQPWELRWGISDAEAGFCNMEDVGSARVLVIPEPEMPTGPHRLLAGLDPDHPDTDRAILRRMFHEDPEKFIAANGTSGINKLMDIAIKDDRQNSLHPFDDIQAWHKLAKDVAKMLQTKEDIRKAPTPVLLLAIAAGCDFSLATFFKTEAEMEARCVLEEAMRKAAR